jgi:hypothetical protein
VEGVTLDHNSNGAVCLYIRTDHNNRIVDRIVVKDAFLDPDSWTCPHKWCGPPQDGIPMKVRCVCMEIQTLLVRAVLTFVMS